MYELANPDLEELMTTQGELPTYLDSPDKPGPWARFDADTKLWEKWLVYQEDDGTLKGAMIGKLGHIFYKDLRHGGWAGLLVPPDAGEVGRLKSEIVRLQDQLFVALRPSEVAAREKQWEAKLLAAQSALATAERERDEAKGDVAELKAKLAHYPVAMMERRDVEKLLRQQLETAEQRLAEVVGAGQALLHGIDDHWRTTAEGRAALTAWAAIAKECAK